MRKMMMHTHTHTYNTRAARTIFVIKWCCFFSVKTKAINYQTIFRNDHSCVQSLIREYVIFILLYYYNVIDVKKSKNWIHSILWSLLLMMVVYIEQSHASLIRIFRYSIKKISIPYFCTIYLFWFWVELFFLIFLYI